MTAPTLRRRASDALFLIVLATVVTVVRLLSREEETDLRHADDLG